MKKAKNDNTKQKKERKKEGKEGLVSFGGFRTKVDGTLPNIYVVDFQ